NMDYLREGIHLRGMAQKDPLVEYRNEGHVLFSELNRTIREEVVALLFHAQIEANEEPGSANGGAALPSQSSGNGGGGRLSYPHETTAGAGAMIAARGGARAPAAAPTTTRRGDGPPQPRGQAAPEGLRPDHPPRGGAGHEDKP